MQVLESASEALQTKQLGSADNQAATDMELEFCEAKATLYRDYATIFGIIVGFLAVALFVGGVNTNPFSPDFVAYRHPGISVPTLIFGILLLMLGRKMGEYNGRVVEIRRSAMERAKSSN